MLVGYRWSPAITHSGAEAGNKTRISLNGRCINYFKVKVLKVQFNTIHLNHSIYTLDSHLIKNIYFVYLWINSILRNISCRKRESWGTFILQQLTVKHSFRSVFLHNLLYFKLYDLLNKKNLAIILTFIKKVNSFSKVLENTTVQQKIKTKKCNDLINYFI